jgi:hypothetical protein
VKGQEGIAATASASPRLGAAIGRFPSAPSDFPTPPLFATAEPGPAERAGGVDLLGSEAFASYLPNTAGRDSRPPEDRDGFDAGALDACLPELSADPTADPDADPGAALLLRVEPARAALEPRRGVGGRGRTERLLALRAAALAVGRESHLSFSKDPAPDSRPPGQGGQRAGTAPVAPTPPVVAPTASASAAAPRSAPLGRSDLRQTKTPLPVGEGTRNSTHEECE